MKRKRLSYAKYGYIFCTPFLITFLIFTLYPIAYTIIIGFTDLKGIGSTAIHFLDDPLQNFKMVLSNNSFQEGFVNTFRMWIMNFIPQILLSLILAAWFTDTRSRIRGQGFFKVVFYMPNIITAATIAILFSALFAYPVGPVNDLIVRFGFAEKGIEFMRSKWLTRCIVAFIQFWMWYGYTMIVLISGILGINPDIFEAAEVDGANRVQTFFRVTLPNLKTIMLFTLVTSLIGGLQMFDIPKMFQDGKPDNATLTASLFIYNQAFAGSYLYNRAAAASMIMFVVIAILSAILFFMMRDKDEIELRKRIKRQEKEYRKKMKKGRK